MGYPKLSTAGPVDPSSSRWVEHICEICQHGPNIACRRTCLILADASRARPARFELITRAQVMALGQAAWLNLALASTQMRMRRHPAALWLARAATCETRIATSSTILSSARPPTS